MGYTVYDNYKVSQVIRKKWYLYPVGPASCDKQTQHGPPEGTVFPFSVFKADSLPTIAGADSSLICFVELSASSTCSGTSAPPTKRSWLFALEVDLRTGFLDLRVLLAGLRLSSVAVSNRVSLITVNRFARSSFIHFYRFWARSTTSVAFSFSGCIK